MTEQEVAAAIQDAWLFMKSEHMEELEATGGDISEVKSLIVSVFEDQGMDDPAGEAAGGADAN